MIVIKPLDCPNCAPSERAMRPGDRGNGIAREIARTFAGRPLISGHRTISRTMWIQDFHEFRGLIYSGGEGNC